MVEMSVLWLRRSAFLALMAAFAFGADPANVSELRRGFERPPGAIPPVTAPIVAVPVVEPQLAFVEVTAIAVGPAELVIITDVVNVHPFASFTIIV